MSEKFVPDPNIKVALFDIAGTLTSVNIWKAMTNSPKIPESSIRGMYLRILPFWLLYRVRIFSEVRFRHLWVKELARLVKGWSEADLDKLFEWGVNSYLAPHYRQDVVAELQALKQNGVYVVLVSNMFESFCDKVAQRLGADKGLGTQLEFSNGVATGKLVGKSLAGSEKVERAHHYLKQVGKDVEFSEAAAAYADSISDVPLLSHAKVATATYPDEQLKREAVKNGWRILS